MENFEDRWMRLVRLLSAEQRQAYDAQVSKLSERYVTPKDPMGPQLSDRQLVYIVERVLVGHQFTDRDMTALVQMKPTAAAREGLRA